MSYRRDRHRNFEIIFQYILSQQNMVVRCLSDVALKSAWLW